ncbi:MAG: MoxR family ATPase [Thermoguttaceae bacterium]|nr:MoxR family ATPase [Thermoguttaceae bacterium]MDO4425274.1 MoxR family ATPase [Planctomycetia bacterium]
MAYTREEMAQLLQGVAADYEKLEHELKKAVVGQEEAVRTSLAALILGGHVLIEGLPGTGKTHLGTSMAEIVTLSSSRIQCTPDLMPTDIIGTHIIMETAQGRRSFEFQKGPLFASIVLVDQINRTSPRTQAAMLEAMEQETVTVATEAFDLPTPFTLIATQNPLEHEGTYPLPEAQVDRFLFQTKTVMPKGEDMATILQRSTGSQLPVLRSVMDGSRILKMRDIIKNVTISNELCSWCVSILEASQPTGKTAVSMVKDYVRYGIGPRGIQALVLAAKFSAAIEARLDVTKNDLLKLAKPALRHRIFLNFRGEAEGISKDEILSQILK